MTLSLSLLIAAVCIVVALAGISWLPLVAWLRRRRRTYELAAQLPGPRNLPLLGHFHMFFGLEPWQVPQLIAQLAEQYDGTFKLKMGSNFSLMMFQPRDMEVVLGSSQLLDKAIEYSFLHGWLNDGLLLSSGQKWHRRRKIITPAFHFRILEPYVEIFDRQTRVLIRKWQQTLGHSFDLGHDVHLFTLDVICGESDVILNGSIQFLLLILCCSILVETIVVALYTHSGSIKRVYSFRAVSVRINVNNFATILTLIPPICSRGVWQIRK